MYKSALCMALLSSISLSAQAFSVESMSITGGTLDVTDSFGQSMFGPMSLTPGSAAIVSDGVNNGVIDADGHHGDASNPVLTAMLMDIPVHGYFAHSAETLAPPCNPTCSLITLADPEPGAITITGSPWDPAITADFSGFFTEWNGNHILQGGTATGTGSWIVIPTVEGGQGVFDFTLSWSAYNAQGPFEGLTGNWTLTGTAVTAVPEAETYALMLAGLGLVGFAARRRRSTQAVPV